MKACIPVRFCPFVSILCLAYSQKGQTTVWDIFQEESIEGNSFASTEGVLSSLIANHVSAISGEFCDQSTDCILKVQIEKLSIHPRKSDIEIVSVGLLWS